jgi:hypothetical protein
MSSEAFAFSICSTHPFASLKAVSWETWCFCYSELPLRQHLCCPLGTGWEGHLILLSSEARRNREGKTQFHMRNYDQLCSSANQGFQTVLHFQTLYFHPSQPAESSHGASPSPAHELTEHSQGAQVSLQLMKCAAQNTKRVPANSYLQAQHLKQTRGWLANADSRQCLDFPQMREGPGVLVHCWVGQGHTSLLVLEKLL